MPALPVANVRVEAFIYYRGDPDILRRSLQGFPVFYRSYRVPTQMRTACGEKAVSK
jgi:hypothetical protein